MARECYLLRISTEERSATQSTNLERWTQEPMIPREQNQTVAIFASDGAAGRLTYPLLCRLELYSWCAMIACLPQEAPTGESNLQHRYVLLARNGTP